MNYTLHKLPEGFIVTSDEEVKYKETWYNPMTADIGINWHEKGIPKEWSKTLKVIAQQDQIDFSSLSEEEQKEIGWVNIDLTKLCHYDRRNPDFQIKEEYGYDEEEVKATGNFAKNNCACDNCFYGRSKLTEQLLKAQELLSDRRFTLEDVLKIADKYHNIMCLYGNVKGIEYLQSLSQLKSWKIELEMGFMKTNEDGIEYGFPDMTQPKLTNGKIKIIKIL